jgi:SAM-dependent methyltransferase
MTGNAREAWQRLYSKHGMQYGGSGDLSMLSSVLGAGMIALDAGCGDGKTTEALSQICDVVGCDFSREALVSLRLQRDPERKVNLVESELTHLPFDSEKFDVVLCVHSLSHVPEDDRHAAASCLSRVLRPRGHLLVEAFSLGDLRFGEGQEVEPASFLRGNGIMTHYFADGEIHGLFPDLEVISEARYSRQVAYGAVSGRREIIRAFLRKK